VGRKENRFPLPLECSAAFLSFVLGRLIFPRGRRQLVQRQIVVAVAVAAGPLVSLPVPLLVPAPPRQRVAAAGEAHDQRDAAAARIGGAVARLFDLVSRVQIVGLE
jgi:hypothetical protein